MTNHRPVLLFDMGLVILLVGSRAGKGDLFALAVAQKGLVDELAAVVLIQSQEWEGQVQAQLANGLRDHDLSFMSQGQAFRPSGG